MKVTFIGATHEVTGSCTLLEVAGKYYLVDCGMEQGKNYFENVPIPVPPSDIEAVFLTHAHIDHSGMLPKLTKDGFKGAIYATEVTRNLCSIMLRDSAHIQISEAEWKNRKGKRAGREEIVEPVYDLNDADCAIRLIRPCDYNKMYSISENVSIRFTDVGHLLGSAAIEIWLTEGDITKKIVFSGDVGNYDRPIVNDPKKVEETDYLVIESTYGNREHDAPQSVIAALGEIFQRTFDRGGNVVIPAFAVGRTQEMLYAIREVKQRGLVKGHDGFPVFLDSPLAVDSTAIFMQCPRDYLDEETLELLDSGVNPIWFPNITLSVTSDDSKAINFNTEPKVIISASGMCDAGRIRHHLKHNLWNEKNTIVFVGYQSEGTLGHALLDEGLNEVTLFGEKIAVKAEITQVHGASGHADVNGLLDWAGGFKKAPLLTFVNHGDDGSCTDFCKTLKEKLGYEATAPFSGTEYDLATGQPVKLTIGIPIPQTDTHDRPLTEAGKKAAGIYEETVDAAKALEDLTKKMKGRSNAELKALTDQINKLLDRYT